MKVRSIVLSLVLLAGLSLLTSCNQRPKNNQQKEVPSSTSVQEMESETPSSRGEEKPLEPLPPTSTEPVTSLENGICTGENFDLQTHLFSFGKGIESQNIMYDSEPLAKCSGMFLRTCRSIAEVCPNASFRDLDKETSTRGEAVWYNNQGRLTLIEDAAGSGHLIRPGAVMFYGYQGKTYTKGENLDMETLAKQGEGIEHMGVVVNVQKEGDQVVSYDMFHGRSTGKPAAITTHYLDPNSRSSSRNDLPAYGNWDQQWVAISFIAER